MFFLPLGQLSSLQRCLGPQRLFLVIAWAEGHRPRNIWLLCAKAKYPVPTPATPGLSDCEGDLSCALMPAPNQELKKYNLEYLHKNKRILMWQWCASLIACNFMLPNSLGNFLDNRVGTRQLPFLVVVDSVCSISLFFLVGRWAMWSTQVHYKATKNTAKGPAYKSMSLLG